MTAVPLVREPEVTDERVKEAYRDIKESLRVSLVDATFQAYAALPKFLDYAWRRLRPSMFAPPFIEQARALGELADAGVASWPISDHAAQLRARNYGDGDVRKLREIVELFHTMIPKLAIIANALRVALGGEPIGGGGVPRPPGHVDRDKLVRDFRGLHVPLVDEREAPLRVRTAFDQMMRGSEAAGVGSLHRAMGAFPDWLEIFWSDMRPLSADPRRSALIERLDQAARDAARLLPYPLYMNASDFAEMRAVNDVLCGRAAALLIDVAVARQGLGLDPTRAR